MSCPSCGSLISATDVRCINCGTVLIEQSQKKTEEFKNAAHWVDNRIYYGVGSFIGFLFALLFFYQDNDLLPKACLAGSIVGGLIGKFVAKQKWQ
jgi:DNA-directed RNA polymerase subunit N (RpoN/RPB10)